MILMYSSKRFKVPYLKRFFSNNNQYKKNIPQVRGNIKLINYQLRVLIARASIVYLYLSKNILFVQYY